MLGRSLRALDHHWTPWWNDGWEAGLRASAKPVHLGNGDDTYFGSDKRGPGDVIYGQAGDDVLHGLRGNDRLYGGGGNDILLGDAGGDRLYGGIGDDQLIGDKGHNFLFGGSGADHIDVHNGTDQVAYKTITDSLPGQTHDTVAFFDTGNDRLDLHRIDAITSTVGDDPFSWIGDQAFSGVSGELRYDPKTDLLQADVTGDGAADFEVYFFGGGTPLQVTDIIL